MPNSNIHPRRIAVLDIGSNSIKLLIAERKGNSSFRILLEKSASTRLGEGVHREARLSEAAIQRTLEAAHVLKLRAQEFGRLEWRAVATSAVREASNQNEFLERFQSRMGFPLQTLSGHREAEWIYRGATSDPLLSKHEQFLVMDSGGGSAEWIQGSRVEIRQRTSLNLGCVRMTERFLKGDPYTEESYRKLFAHYQEQLASLRSQFSAENCAMIGTGGSIASLAAIDRKLRSLDSEKVHGHTLALGRLEELLEQLRRITDAERSNLGTLSPRRSDIIVAGVALFSVAMSALGATELIVSLRGLRYGILMQD